MNKRLLSATAVILLFLLPVAALAGEIHWVPTSGQTLIHFEDATLERYGLVIELGQEGGGEAVVGAIALPISDASALTTVENGRVVERYDVACIRHSASLLIASADKDVHIDELTVRTDPHSAGAWLLEGSRSEGAPFSLADTKVGFDRVAAKLLIEAGEIRITAGLADALGNPDLEGVAIGSLLIEADLTWSGGDAPADYYATLGGADGPTAGSLRTTCNNPVGPDVIVGDMPGVSSYTSVGGIKAYAVGTDSCNIGDEELLWISSTNEHPVIGQNMYRLNNNRFEQVGMSWLKHGFTALTQNICDCGCASPGTGSRLGIGCSDPYSSSLNGSQTRLGPRSEVNAYTGQFTYPFTSEGQTGDSVYKRLQVHISDLDPAQNGGGTYFVEGHYVTPDDAAAGNQLNNASYRQISIGTSANDWDASFSGMPETVRERPAIYAWPATDPFVDIGAVDIPQEGQVILAAKSIDLGGGMWRYEYAVQNIDSDRSIGSFTIPVGTGATVSNIGFHDVDYHSGEPYDGTDWPGTFNGGVLTWATTPHAINPNANALRWGTLYNFRFDTDAPPTTGTLTLGLFKPGTPSSVTVTTTVPAAGPLDCNANSVDDTLDISGGTSHDCNGNTVPDECETFSPTPIKAELVASGLSNPIFVTAPRNDSSRLFIVEQTGAIKILDFGSGTVLASPFLDMSSLISSGFERGLLSMAFHPNYGVNGFFFVNYTNTAGSTVIARYTVSANPDIADAGSAVILKTITQPESNHNGGQLQFGADGMLYVGMGDGGGAGDLHGTIGNGQDPLTLLGKMLRLDVDGGAPYVPADNPFVGDPTTLDEIWALGLRNPWRFSFDRLTGDMYIGDVGQGTHEEIDFEAASSPGGLNYGWRCYEGDFEYNTTGCGAVGDYTFPILDIPHSFSSTCSITGGYVYRGCAMPDLSGAYFYSDYCGDYIRSFRYDGSSVTEDQDRTAELGGGSITTIVGFGEDADGELYIVSLTGTVHKIVPDLGPVCGNNQVEPGEQCDDGNTTPGDGCDANCQIEVSGDNDDCAGAAVICPGAYTGTTSDATNDGTSSCGSSSSSPDRWYSYTPGADGTATFSLCTGTGYDAVISVHSACSGGTEFGCDDDGCGQSGGPSTLTLGVTAGIEYLIRVTGWNNNSGSYTLTLTGPECGSTVCETVLFADNFENGNINGWDLYAADSTATTGAGVIGDPVGTVSGSLEAQPEDAFEGTGCLFTAQNTSLGVEDVDGGVVYFESPTIDLSGVTNAKLSFARWYFNRTPSDDAGDFYIAQVSDDNGANWTTLETIGDDQNPTDWNEVTFDLESTIALTNTMRIRFGASDGAAIGDIIELAIDALSITTPCPDCNTNGIDDADDIAGGTSADADTNGIPDECEVMSGIVRDQNTLAPIADALVSLQASSVWTVSAADGSFTLNIGSDPDLVIVGAKEGYFNGSVTVSAPSNPVDILLEAVPQDHDLNYEFVAPENCASCHPNQYSEWLNTPMAKTGQNAWVHDVFDGTGTPGGMGGFVYTRDSLFATTTPNSECASCHQPELWIKDPLRALEGPTEPGYPSAGVVHGISCETCHKVADVDLNKINFPGIFPGAVTFTLPQTPVVDQVMYGVLGDTDFVLPGTMRTSFNPQIVAETCATCHQDAADPNEDHSYDGVISEPTYLEWIATPYGDINSPQYATCVDCHMPASGETEVCSVLNPPLTRDPNRIRSHTIEGTTPQFLENAVELSMQTERVGNKINVSVDIANTMTGHHVPTGVSIRNMILLVEAWRDEDGQVLSDTGTQVIHDLGGIGDPAQGYYAGLPGKLYAKFTQDINSNGPTFFTEADTVRFDTRIPALDVDSTGYSFAIPGGDGTAQIRARLIYRRAWRFFVDAKQWTEDGHGNPLADIAPPHFGHLMEMAETTIGFLAHDGDGDGDVDLDDYDLFADCYTGPNAGPVAPQCTIADSDNDDDVDLEDYASFQAAMAN